MTIPNYITIARFIAVPVIVYALLDGLPMLAFVLFVAAGLSDAIDGIIARHFNQRSDLGAYLDPIADKLLLVSVFVVLGIVQSLPAWLVVLVVSRDFLIVAAVLLSSLMENPVEMRPIVVSKFNTAAQIVLIVLVLAAAAFQISLDGAITISIYVVAVLTLFSGAAYLSGWIRHISHDA